MTRSLPRTATPAFADLCDYIRHGEYATPVPLGPGVAETICAQFAQESGWGTSRLARDHRNYAGMKWRDGMRRWATRIVYSAHDGRTAYCHFRSHAEFVAGYFQRLDLMDAYDGWRGAAARGGDQFINHIGPPWLGMTPADNQQYVRKVLAIRDRYWPEWGAT